jgi:hypothetical protein
VPKFIEYRLASAGYHGLRLFTDEAIELIASFSGGIPRLINTLCNNALMIAFAEDKRNVNANHVKAAAKDLLLDDSEPGADLSPDSEDTGVPEDTVVDFSSTIVGEDEESDSRNLQDQHRTAKTHTSRRWVAIATIALALGLGFLFTGNSNPNRTGSALDFVDHLWQDVGNKINQLKDSLSGNESHEDDSAGLPPTQRGDLPAATERVANNDGANDFEPVAPESLQRPKEELANVALVYESESVDLSTTDSPILPVTTAEKDTSPPPTETGIRAQPYLDEGETHTKQPDSPRSPEAQLGTPTTLGKALDTHTPPADHAPAVDPVNAGDDLAEETGSEYAPNAGESGVPPAASTELDSRQALLEAVDTQIDQSSQAQPVSRPNARTILGSTTHIVKNGETISDLANELYGRSGLYQMISVQISNPELADLNVIFEDQEIDFPQLFSDIMVFTDGEGSHGALIGTTRSLSKATKWQSEISSRQNNPAVIKTMQLPDNTDVYLVEITGYPNPELLVSEINNEPTLRKIFSESMYESL